MPALSAADAKAVFDLLGLTASVLCIDVGAMALAEPDPWSRYAQEGCTKVVGFEPNTAECQKLQSQNLKNQIFMPQAIGNGAEMTLHITNTAMTSSLLEPDLERMGQFTNLAELCQVVSSQQLATARLDDITETRGGDFLKLDIQGGELMALQHAENLLKSLLVIQTEVEFLEIYRQQPLFADIDQFLRGQGFVFHHFSYLSGRTHTLPKTPEAPKSERSQTLWGDAVYIRDPNNLTWISSTKILNMAFIMMAFYRADDLALRLLNEVDQRSGKGRYADLVQWLKLPRQQEAVLPLINGQRLVVPNNLNMITPYVLVEQGAWFEDEWSFVNRLVAAGDHVLDIGANYGLYTLQLAKAVAPGGTVQAFEPASRTARFLRSSLNLNALNNHVQVHQMALSAAPGTGYLELHNNAELNALGGDHKPQTATTSGHGDQNMESVRIESLDHLLLQGAATDQIRFVKIDAEGQEGAIIAGGKGFLQQHLPVVMFEVKAGRDFHLKLVDDFAAIRFSCFRLVPGLQLLAPIPPSPQLDPYTLNLFACPAERERELEQQGLLVKTLRSAPEQLPDTFQAAAMAELIQLPYSHMLQQLWHQHATPSTEILATAIRYYLASQRQDRAAAIRLADLQHSYNLIKDTVEADASQLRLATFARIAAAYGQRAEAVRALTSLANQVREAGQVKLQEPFLLPCRRYEAIKPKPNQIGQFIYAAVLEELNNLASYSSFYTPDASLERLKRIEQLGFAAQRTLTTIKLIQRRLNNRTAS